MFRSLISAAPALLLASAGVLAQSSTQCTEGKQEILYPAPNTNITQVASSQCSHDDVLLITLFSSMVVEPFPSNIARVPS
jgi:hypothetical protein